MKAAPEAPVTFADPSHEDWEAEGRVSGYGGYAAHNAQHIFVCIILSSCQIMTPRVAQLPLSTLEDGDVITGVISDVWLYHGCQVDFGYEFDGFVI